MDIIEITQPETVVVEIAPNVVEVERGGPQGRPGDAGPAGPAVADGDKGDIVVSGSGLTWTIDPALLTAFMRTVTVAADEAAFKAAVNLEIGVDVQAYSAILAATTASFLTAHATKLGHISITQAVDLDAIETRVNALDAAVVLKGVWDASAGTFPGGGTAQAGDSYIVSVAGTVDGAAFALNDRIIAVADNASTTTFAANWFKADYTDQVLSVAGKTGAVTLQVADITDMTANGRSLVSAADYAAMRTLLGLVIGTNVQAQGATLTALEALSFVQGDIVYFSAADTPVRLPKGAAGDVLTMNVGATAPSWVAPAAGTPPSFSAHKNGTDQTGITSGALTTVTFGTEEWDEGGYFASNGWTPPAGRYRISACVTSNANIVAGSLHLIRLMKNGVRVANLDYQQAPGTAQIVLSGSKLVAANGTDVFTIIYYGDGAGDKTILGAAEDTYFQGEAL